MNWLYLNSSLSDRASWMCHQGQAGILQGLRQCGESTMFLNHHVSTTMIPSAMLSDPDLIILTSFWYGDLAWALTTFPEATVIPILPSIDVAVCDDLLRSDTRQIPLLVGQADSPPTITYYRRTTGLSYRCWPFGSNGSGIPWPSSLAPRLYSWVFAGSSDNRPNWGEYISPLIARSAGQDYRLWEAISQDDLLPWPSLMAGIYPAAVVCPNFHCPEQKCPGTRQDANQRLFDLAAVGACQVVDWFPLLDTYFEDDELIKAKTPEEWVDKVIWYSVHPREAEAYGERARRRWQADHTWRHRAQQLMDWLDRKEAA